MNNSQHVRTATGILIIVFGIVTLLGSLDVIDFGNLLGTWWPILIIIASILILLNDTKRFVLPLSGIAAGLLWQLDELDVIEFNVWQLFWPAIIIAIGWSILKDRKGAVTDTHDENFDTINAILGGVETKNESKQYTGGKLFAMMGGGVLDLRHATIKKEATIEVFALMGGFEIKVPEGWVVRSKVTPILGGVENKTLSHEKANRPVLNIVGTAVMGGVEVKH